MASVDGTETALVKTNNNVLGGKDVGILALWHHIDMPRPFFCHGSLWIGVKSLPQRGPTSIGPINAIARTLEARAPPDMSRMSRVQLLSYRRERARQTYGGIQIQGNPKPDNLCGH